MEIKSLGDYPIVVVTIENFARVISELNEAKDFAIDVETTGLFAYVNDRLFSFSIFDGTTAYYFNFNDIPDNTGMRAPVILPRRLIKELKFLDKKERELVAHNAKFEMHFLGREGLEFATSPIYCTNVAARLVNNQLTSYKLEALGALIGYPKDATVKEYIKKHKLYRKDKYGENIDRYDLVPFEIIGRYCCHDSFIAYKLKDYTKKRIEEISKEQEAVGVASIYNVLATEQKVTRVLYKMEKHGVLVDTDYAKKAFLHYCDKYTAAAEEIYRLSGVTFQDAPTVLKEIYTKLGVVAKKTAKGRDSFSKDNLPPHEITEHILEYRRAYKMAHTYYENFLDLVDRNNKIHTNFRQSGTNTGRLSCSAPNLQNVPKRGEDLEEYKARGCIIPEAGTFFYMPDFDQMEYRKLLDTAEEMSVIDKVLGGLDVHTATAQDMGVDRFAAKTLNFMLLYGGGAEKLANALGISVAEGKRKKALYFKTLSNVSNLVRALIDTVEKRKWITNWYGRKLMIPPQGSYAIANHYIQGGCADIVKIAMVKLDEFLEGKKSKMLLQVHDEILFQIDNSEAHILPELNKLMREAYPAKYLPLTCGSDYSISNWHEKRGIKCLESFSIESPAS